MAHIMCSQKLWSALGQAGKRRREAIEPGTMGAVLGSWAAKTFQYDGRALVVAVNERTFLTLVFPLPPPHDFRAQFAIALRAILEDVGVLPSAIEQEVMVCDFLPFAWLTDRRLRVVLDDLEFFGRCELDYTDDLRRVQLNLNQVPHYSEEAECPIETVAQLLSANLVAPSRQRPH